MQTHVTPDGIYGYCSAGDWSSGPYRSNSELNAKFDEHAASHRGANERIDFAGRTWVPLAEYEAAFADAERAWATVAEFQRRLLIVANAVRGTDRYLNGRKHQGQRVNTGSAE